MNSSFCVPLVTSRATNLFKTREHLPQFSYRGKIQNKNDTVTVSRLSDELSSFVCRIQWRENSSLLCCRANISLSSLFARKNYEFHNGNFSIFISNIYSSLIIELQRDMVRMRNILIEFELLTINSTALDASKA